jgi:hypothetical protein
VRGFQLEKVPRRTCEEQVILVQCHTRDLDLDTEDFETERTKQTNYGGGRSSPERQPREASRIFLTGDSVKNFLCPNRNKSRSAPQGEVDDFNRAGLPSGQQELYKYLRSPYSLLGSFNVHSHHH